MSLIKVPARMLQALYILETFTSRIVCAQYHGRRSVSRGDVLSTMGISPAA